MQAHRSSLAASIAFLVVTAVAPLRAIPQDLSGEEPPAADAEEGPPPSDRTPPRLSHIDGSVSFWRQGAEDWTQARVNTPLAPGDQLYIENGSNLELQIGPRDFLRAASNSQLAFDNEETEYQQFRLTSGQASLDLRGMRAGRTVEVDTPNGAFTVDHNGYYRVEVDADATHFSTRRGGRATVTTASGDPEDVSPSEEVVVRGDDVESYAASEPDAWDRWNYDRSDQLVEAVSYRHVPEEVYGVDDLDHNGRWRVVPRYGSVWFPSAVASGWAPYTAGRWVLDPYFGWTWIDDAAWGWAPFHYGRWVYVDDFWGWAPGPIIARPYYAPALVAFFSVGPVSIGLSLGAPVLGWTALGWGEPCRPWWGPAEFIGRPRWFGWGGPRVTINQTTINHIDVYQNARVRNAMVFVNRDEFARGPVGHARLASFDPARVRAIDGALPLRSDAARVVGGAARGQRPPEAMLDRRVVATRASAAPSGGGWFRRSEGPSNPPAQLVPSPRDARAHGNLQRPRPGEQVGVERAAPPPLPRFDDVRSGGSRPPPQEASNPVARSPGDATAREGARRGSAPQAERARAARPPAGPQPSQTQNGVDRHESQRAAARRAAPRSEAPRTASPPTAGPRSGQPAAAWNSQPGSPRASRELPGQPANRVWAGRSTAGAAAPNAAPRSPAFSRSPQPQRAASPHRAASQQDAAAAGDAQTDAASRGRGPRVR